MCHPIPVARPLQQAIPNHCTAKTLGPGERLTLGVQALAGNHTITGLTEEAGVSRKFVYQQADIAQAALDDAFASTDADDKVLFHLPITKDWLRHAALGLTLICHSSYRGVHEFFRDLLNVHMAPSTVHNIVHDAIDKARLHNLSQDLAKVDIAGLDEIFQNGQPVLVGADSRSTYCFLLRITEITTSRFLGPVARALARSWRNHGLKPALRNREVIFRELLSAEDQRDADTWALRLLECQDHGFAPTATIADFGTGIRAGQERAKLVSRALKAIQKRALDRATAPVLNHAIGLIL